jgi:DNA-binding Xre family transcriptional regulator
MALKLQVQEIGRRQGIENAAQLAKLTGLGIPSCYQLWHGKAKAVSLKTLNTLCNKLRTHPAILFDYEPDSEEENSITIKSRKGSRK